MKIFNSITFVLIIAVFTGLVSCTKDKDAEAVKNVKLLIVNAVSGIDDQEVYIDNKKLDLSLVEYGDAAAEVTVSSGAHSLAFKTPGVDTVNATTRIAVEANTSQMVFLTGKRESKKYVKTFVNDKSNVNAKVKLRIINTEHIMMIGTHVKTADGVTLGFPSLHEASVYHLVDAGSDLELNMRWGKPFHISGADLKAGKVYTMWFYMNDAWEIKYRFLEHQ